MNELLNITGFIIQIKPQSQFLGKVGFKPWVAPGAGFRFDIPE